MTRRIRIYLIGVLLGSVLVYFTLIKNRERNLMGWLPNERVLQELSGNDLELTEKAKCLMNCFKTEHADIKYILNEGNVLLSESQPRNSPKVYFVEAEIGNQNIIAGFRLYEKKTVLFNVVVSGSDLDCKCNGLND